MAEAIDQINEPRRKLHLTLDAVLGADGHRGDEGKVLGLQGDGLRIELIEKLLRQGVMQIPAQLHGHAEAGRINTLGVRAQANGRTRQGQ